MFDALAAAGAVFVVAKQTKAELHIRLLVVLQTRKPLIDTRCATLYVNDNAMLLFGLEYLKHL